jgi:hypothetical protein
MAIVKLTRRRVLQTAALGPSGLIAGPLGTQAAAAGGVVPQAK